MSIEGAFSVFDTDEDGKITYPELMKGFEELKIPITKLDVQWVFAIIDIDNNGTISLGEFLEWLGVDEESQPQKQDPTIVDDTKITNQDLEKAENDLKNKGIKPRPPVDENLLNGELKIQVAKGVNIPDDWAKGYKTYYLML